MILQARPARPPARPPLLYYTYSCCYGMKMFHVEFTSGLNNKFASNRIRLKVATAAMSQYFQHDLLLCYLLHIIYYSIYYTATVISGQKKAPIERKTKLIMFNVFFHYSPFFPVPALFSGPARSYRHTPEISIDCVEPDRYGQKKAKKNHQIKTNCSLF